MRTAVLGCATAILLGISSPALSWEEAYHTDFASDPGWATNNAARYCWNSADQDYRVTMYDNTDEYATISVSNPSGAFKVQFDLYIDSMNWAGNVNFGLYDSSRNAGYGPSPGKQFVAIDFGTGDLGKGIFLNVEDKDGTYYNPYHYPTSNWDYNTWYTGVLTYDGLGTLSWELRRQNETTVIDSLSIAGISGFDALSELGASKVGDWYAPSAYGQARIDNVSLYVPEPASIALLMLGVLTIRRRRRA